MFVIGMCWSKYDKFILRRGIRFLHETVMQTTSSSEFMLKAFVSAMLHFVHFGAVLPYSRSSFSAHSSFKIVSCAVIYSFSPKIWLQNEAIISSIDFFLEFWQSARRRHQQIRWHNLDRNTSYRLRFVDCTLCQVFGTGYRTTESSKMDKITCAAAPVTICVANQKGEGPATELMSFAQYILMISCIGSSSQRK